MAVSLSSTKSLRIALGARQVATVIDGQYLTWGDGMPPKVEPGQAQAIHGFDQAISFAQQAFEKLKASGHVSGRPLPKWLGAQAPGVTLFLDNAWVRNFVCCWDPALKTTQDFLRYAEIEFERRFHSPVEDWTLMPDRLRPGGETVMCAYRRDQLKALEDLVAKAGFSIASTLPAIVAEVALLKLPRGPSPLMYVGTGHQSKNVCWIEEGRIRDFLVMRTEALHETALSELFITRLKRSPVEKMLLMRSQSTPSQTLRMLVTGQTPESVISNFSASQEELSL
jgi:hypothetical protein